MKAEHADELRRMGVLADKPHCEEIMRLRWNYYHYNGVAERLKSWQHPNAAQWASWADQFAVQIRLHHQTCKACIDFYEGIIDTLQVN